MSEFWKPTAQMFTSLFEKPKMAQKLLQKPPFKYLFDIITQTTKVTGFAKGLYTGDQLSPDYYSQRDRKINYLQKLITLVQLMSQQQVSAKPQKIVAGLQPEQTNLLLQMMYKQAASGNSSQPFVKKVLGGNKPQQKSQEKVQQKPQKKPDTQKEIPQEDKTKNPPPQKKPVLGIKQQTDPQKKPVQIKQPLQQKKTPVQQKKPPIQQKKQPPIVRPPSAKIKPAQNKQQQIPSQKIVQQPPPPPPIVQKQKSRQKIVDEDQQQQQNIPMKSKNAIKPQIQAENYSKKVRQAMQQEKQTDEVEANNQQPVNKINMGKLKKPKKQKIQGSGGVTSGGQITQKQLELVKNMIQTICQNSTPLGKSIQFVNDDIQSMNQELLFWRKQYNVSKVKLQNELKITQQALIPLYDKLAQIDEQIKDQKGKIQNIKSQIIKNQSTIRDLLISVVTTK